MTQSWTVEANLPGMPYLRFLADNLEEAIEQAKDELPWFKKIRIRPPGPEAEWITVKVN